MTEGPPRPSARRRRLVRFVFLVVGALLLAQAGYAYVAQEPYPSFVFPSFPGAPDDGDPVRLVRPTLTVRFGDPDRLVVVPYHQLLQPAPGVVADSIAYTMLAPRSSEGLPKSTPAQFRLFLQQPSFRPGAHNGSATLRDPATVAWLRARLAKLYPGHSPRSLEITWEERRYADQRATAVRVRPVARLLVPLGG
jgi:hypothetical protein